MPRPPASYLYPRVWFDLAEVGLAANHITLKNLVWSFSNDANFRLPYSSRLSNRLLEQKFRVEEPNLVDFKTAADVVYLVSYKRRAEGLSPVTEAGSLVAFNHMVTGLGDRIESRATEHGEFTVEFIAGKTGLTEDVIRSVAAGRLVPSSIAVEIAAIAGLPADSVVPRRVGRQGPPVNHPECIRSIADKLAA